MSTPPTGNSRPHGHGHQNGHAAGHDGALVDVLELDARVLPFAPDVVRHLAEALAEPPSRILDLGAGAGSGSLALADRFPSAHVIAVDRSAVMAQRLREVFAAADLGSRTTVRQAEVDGGWSSPEPVDLVWASLVLHEFPEPASVLAAVRSALRPGGSFAVVEMDAPPSFLPDDAGVGLEDRVHAELATVGGRPAHPRWTAALEEAGFTDVQEHRVTLEVSSPPDLVRRFAVAYLTLVVPALEGRLAPADLSGLRDLLAPDGPRALGRRDLTLRASRTLWVARRG